MMERHAYLSSPRVLLVALPDATRINGVYLYNTVLSTRLNQPFRYFMLFPFLDMAV